MNWLHCTLGALAAWRVTHLLAAEDGPWDALIRFRRRLATRILGNNLDCFYCASLWVSIPFAIIVGQTWRDILLLWPALSAAAILLEDLSARLGPLGAAAYVVEGEQSHELLREEQPHAGAAE